MRKEEKRLNTKDAEKTILEKCSMALKMNHGEIKVITELHHDDSKVSPAQLFCR